MTPRSLSFARSRRGTAALEFAIVAPVFLSLIFSCFEGGWYMTKSMLLDRALNKTVRLMRIGAAGAPTTQQAVKQAVCDEMMIISNCLNVLTVEMTKITSASDFPTTQMPCIDRGATIQPTIAFTPGSRSSIMFIRACVVSDPLTPGLGFALALPKDSLGGYGLRAAAAFMNEPSS
ncbi:pilus assembly protein [Aurantimonas sp. MSK8Z-1]|uniref:TadE/TadG family type IV pilus assembly protein n=1 Tax=Mangrovibrevibacter kandeliae TaxID=2968473 RepID=UPI002119655F|nr:TadE/TadG family type IV pilus assembly protein [Aurantimonas sp. MSK8Z-1]MCW4115305.1 pilus assembly protein [Aurantimonas sp. MSK8Z-1]